MTTAADSVMFVCAAVEECFRSGIIVRGVTAAALIHRAEFRARGCVITGAADIVRASWFVLCVIVRGVAERFARHGVLVFFRRFAEAAAGRLIRRSGTIVHGVSRSCLVKGAELRDGE